MFGGVHHVHVMQLKCIAPILPPPPFLGGLANVFSLLPGVF